MVVIVKLLMAAKKCVAKGEADYNKENAVVL
jgi:hypothetical protein